MGEIKDGGPAFPHTGHVDPGLTRRDWFAGRALQGMLAHSTRYKPRPVDAGRHWHDAIAREAYELADAMLAAREGGSNAE